MIILILIYLAFIIGDAWLQSIIIKSHWIKHTRWSIVVGIVALTLALIHTRNLWPPSGVWPIVRYIVATTVFFFFLLILRWLVFDIALNLFRGKDWLYAGEPLTPESRKRKSFIDSLPWGEHPGRTMLFVKIGLLILLTVLIIRL